MLHSQYVSQNKQWLGDTYRPIRTTRLYTHVVRAQKVYPSTWKPLSSVITPFLNAFLKSHQRYISLSLNIRIWFVLLRSAGSNEQSWKQYVIVFEPG